MIIDLSHEFKEDITLYPGTAKPIIEQINKLELDGYNQLRLTFTNHIGTHLDVQAHMIEGGKEVTDYDISHFQGRGKVFDCRNVEEIGKEVFEGKITDIEFILIWTDYDKRFNDLGYLENYPILSEEAIDYILSSNIKGIGVDCISVDPIKSTKMIVHKKLLGNDIIIYENLCDLNLLVSKDFVFMGFPLKIKGDGIQVRAVAEIDK